MSTEQIMRKGYNDYLLECEKDSNKVMSFQEYLTVILSGLTTSKIGAV